MTKYLFGAETTALEILGDATVGEALGALREAARTGEADPARTTCGHYGCRDHEQPEAERLVVGAYRLADAERITQTPGALVRWVKGALFGRDLTVLDFDGEMPTRHFFPVAKPELVPVGMRLFDAPTGGNLIAEVDTDGNPTWHGDPPLRVYAEPAS